MMHQSIQDGVNSVLVTSVCDLVSRLDLIQCILLLNKLGNFDEDYFVVLAQHVYSTNLKNLSKNTPAGASIIFDGGPNEHTQFKATVASFIADRVLRSFKSLGTSVVCQIIEDIVAWKGCEDEPSLEWDELESRYAG